ncbi:MAG: molecular chaperone HtpG [Firmicutes bacterium]|nr:molecular chaperone HtpG [Bacillota bacterium]
MKKKQFKTESKKILDLMINSVYTNRDIFLRELISNASDAIDKLYYKSLTDDKVKLDKDEFCIKLDLNKEDRVITITDNGIGMTEEELDENLGVIAKSGSSLFKEMHEKQADINIIGQFGVGFYSAFMVAKEIRVLSKAYGSEEAYLWVSDGADGYEITKAEKEECGTVITLVLKDNTDTENYDEYLEERRITGIVKKYSDYVKYPIMMREESKDEEDNKVSEDKTLNSMIPIWKKKEADVTEEEYNSFYADKFYDFEAPVKTIHSSVEGQVSYNSLLFVPSHAPYDYYTKDYEKGLQLYSNGVLIMDKCADLLPDYFSFIKGLVDSEDISLNLSRELLQQDRQLRLIAKSLEKKIKSSLEEMLEEDREGYEKFFEAFGMQLKYGIYSSYGNNDTLKDLLMFYSSKEKKRITLKEYVENMKEDQEKIYYASGESLDKIDLLPNVERFKDKEYEVLYLVDYVDEFTIQALNEYEGKKFANVASEDVSLDSPEEKEELDKKNEEAKGMFDIMKEALTDVKNIKFTNKLKNHPVCLSTEGAISLEMEKIMKSMPVGGEDVKADIVLEINEKHPIADKLKELYISDKDALADYTKILYNQARLIEGLSIDNPTELTNLICDMMSK